MPKEVSIMMTFNAKSYDLKMGFRNKDGEDTEVVDIKTEMMGELEDKNEDIDIKSEEMQIM